MSDQYDISYSVGLKGKAENRSDDVKVIQILLNKCQHLSSKLGHLSEDGVIGPKTEEAILAFQSDVLKLQNPDGIISPDKITHSTLLTQFKEEDHFKKIPRTINGVSIGFDDSVNRWVSPSLIDALKHLINKSDLGTDSLRELFIFSACDKHQPPSRHTIGKAVDISRVNGKRMGVYYPGDEDVKEIVDALQKRFDETPGARENFGPSLKNKHGHPYKVSGHNDHIHLSVD